MHSVHLVGLVAAKACTAFSATAPSSATAASYCCCCPQCHYSPQCHSSPSATASMLIYWYPVAAATAMSDRLCIAGQGTGSANASFLELSAMDLTSCDFQGENMGCLGGIPSTAWKWGQQHGLVTAKCLPYLKSNGGAIDTCQPGLLAP